MSRAQPDAARAIFGSTDPATEPARPGFAPARLLSLMRDAIARVELDLTGLTILTEAATGAYSVTPVIAALAGAKRVYGFTRQSPYGTVSQAREHVGMLGHMAGVAKQIVFVDDLPAELAASIDIVTNSGHLRPVGASLIDMLPDRAVIALMFEAWELRDGDIDLAACRRRGIPVVGVNERNPSIGVFPYLGALCVKMLHDAGVAVCSSRVAVLCDNPFGPSIVRGLAGLGATVEMAPAPHELPADAWDAVIVALWPGSSPRIDGNAAAWLARAAPGTIVAQLWGDIDRGALALRGLRCWPPSAPKKGHMAILLSEIGPEPVVRLQVGGLKAAELVQRRQASSIGDIAQII